MKKPTRIKRRAMIETGKTVAIVVLCLCCVFFLYSIWELYKGQVSIGQAFWGTESSTMNGTAKSEDVVNSFRSLVEPELIMVGQANARAVLNHESQEYVRAVTAINDVVKGVYSCQPSAFEATELKLWQNVISNGVVYARYPCTVSTAFEKPFVISGESAMTGAVRNYEDLLIAPSVTSDKGVTVFVKDSSTLQTFKVELDVPSKELRSIIESCPGKKNNAFVFAHELNLDTPREEEIGESMIMLDSMFLIPLEKTAANNIVTSVPEAYANGLGFSHTNEFTSGLLSVFGYNPNTVRQYANDDGALIFVGDTGSLSLRPDGRIEYKALGENEGISFMTSGRTEADPRGVMSGLTGMLNTVFSVCGVTEESSYAYLRMTEMPDMNNPGDIRIKMEYYADDNRILLGTEPAVDAVIKNGVLVELRIKVKSVEKTEERTPCQDAFRAIDDFCEKNPLCKKIKKGNLVYKAFEDGKATSAVWQIQGE